MKIRAMHKYVNDDNVQTSRIVWFNSYGKDANGNKLPANSFLSNADYIANDLLQKLSVIKSELWYDVNFGIPLLDKPLSKQAIDTAVLSIITKHSAILAILNFQSTIVANVYTANITMSSIYGDISINI